MSGEKPANSVSTKVARNQHRLQLRALNTEVWHQGKPTRIPESRSLDTSLKKNTAFIRRCRVNLKDKDTLVREVETLSLEKYLSEIIPALVEGFTKCKTSSDLFLGVEVASALHQRFGPELFTGKFISIFLSGIVIPKKSALADMSEEEVDDLYRETTARHKVILRSIIELWLTGIYRSTEDIAKLGYDIPAFAKRSKGNVIGSPPLVTLHEILSNDPKSFHGKEIAISVIKSYGSILLDDTDDELITTELKQDFELEFDWYIKQMEKTLTSARSAILSEYKNNERSFLTYGKINEDKTDVLDKRRSKVLQLIDSYNTLCGLLHKEAKEYDLSCTQEDSVAISIAAATHEDSIWEDDEQKKFYENIPDYSFKSGQPRAVPTHNADEEKNLADELAELAQNTQETEERKQESSKSAQEDEEIDDEYDDDEEDFTVEKTKEPTKGPLVELLGRLSLHPSREIVDEIALEYLQYDGKSARETVSKILTKELKIQNTFQLPFVARFLAIISSFAPTVIDDVLEYLADFFTYLQKKKHIKKLGNSRTFVLTYVAELTKFGLTSKYYIGRYFIQMARSLVETNAEGLSLLLELCGRYVSRKPKTAVFMNEFMKNLQKSMKQQFLSVEHRIQLENAITYTLPLEKYEKEEKVRPVIELFIRHLIYHELNSNSAQPVLLKLRKLDWNDQDTFKAVRKAFTKIHQVSFSNVSLMAWLLQALSLTYPVLAVIVIDALLEDIRKQLEINHFRYNQRRVAEMRYLGSLFVYQLVDSDVVFRTLHLLLTFGHENGKPQVDKYNRWDPPDDFLRIRLVCTLLDTSGVVEKLNSKPEDKAQLESFIRLFAYYLFTKEKLSMDVEFAVTDTLRKVNPNLKLPSDISEAISQLESSVNEEKSASEEKSVSNGSTEEKSSRGSRKLSEKGMSFKRGIYGMKVENETEKPTKATSAEEQLEVLEAERRREKALSKARQAAEDAKAEEEFEEEFQKLMLDRIDGSSTVTRQPVFDAPVPEVLTDESFETFSGDKPQMKYQLMMKKSGTNEYETRPVEVPTDFRKVIRIQNERQKRVEEQTKVRKFVLNYMEKDHSDESLASSIQRINQPQILSTRYTRRKEQTSSRGIPAMPDIPPELQS